MDEFEKLAADIIDTVEEKIREAHPEIEKIVPKEDEDGNVIDTLLHGEAYYDLEGEVASLLREKSRSQQPKREAGGSRILILNWPEPGRFGIVRADRNFDSFEDALAWFSERSINVDDVLFEGGSEFVFDWWIAYNKEDE